MKTLKRTLILAGCFLAMGLGTTRVMAQGAGAAPAPPPISAVYDKILESERRELAVTSEDEWQVLLPKLLKVVQLKTEAHTMSVRLLFGSYFPRGGGVVRGGRGRGATPIEVQVLTGLVPGVVEPEVDALMQRAMSDQPNTNDLKVSMTRLRDARKKRQADLAKAESDLRSVLTHRQETALEARGLLEMQTAAGMQEPAGRLLVNFDPALQRIMATNRIFMAVSNDDDWAVISSRLLPVLKMKFDEYAVEVNSLFLLNGVRATTQLPPGRPDIGLDLGSRALTGELTVSLDPAEHGFQSAVQTHAPPENVTAAAANAQAVREQRATALAQARSYLLEVLTRKQEAVMVALGMLE
jgi:hypothetical protein